MEGGGVIAITEEVAQLKEYMAALTNLKFVHRIARARSAVTGRR